VTASKEEQEEVETRRWKNNLKGIWKKEKKKQPAELATTVSMKRRFASSTRSTF